MDNPPEPPAATYEVWVQGLSAPVHVRADELRIGAGAVGFWLEDERVFLASLHTMLFVRRVPVPGGPMHRVDLGAGFDPINPLGA